MNLFLLLLLPSFGAAFQNQAITDISSVYCVSGAPAISWPSNPQPEIIEVPLSDVGATFDIAPTNNAASLKLALETKQIYNEAFVRLNQGGVIQETPGNVIVPCNSGVGMANAATSLLTGVYTPESNAVLNDMPWEVDITIVVSKTYLPSGVLASLTYAYGQILVEDWMAEKADVVRRGGDEDVEFDVTTPAKWTFSLEFLPPPPPPVGFSFAPGLNTVEQSPPGIFAPGPFETEPFASEPFEPEPFAPQPFAPEPFAPELFEPQPQETGGQFIPVSEAVGGGTESLFEFNEVGTPSLPDPAAAKPSQQQASAGVMDWNTAQATGTWGTPSNEASSTTTTTTASRFWGLGSWDESSSSRTAEAALPKKIIPRKSGEDRSRERASTSISYDKLASSSFFSKSVVAAGVMAMTMMLLV